MPSWPGAGFRAGVPTFFTWEGVTQYVSRQAVEDTLAFVGSVAGPGSRIAFSYILRGVIEGTDAAEVDRRVMARARKGGSPWRTGFGPEEVPAVLERHGLRLTEEVGGEDYRRRYLEPAGRQMATLASERVVLAEKEG